MNCQICGKKSASIKKVTKSFGRGPRLVVIEDIPVLSCSSCHESYVTADTGREKVSGTIVQTDGWGFWRLMVPDTFILSR